MSFMRICSLRGAMPAARFPVRALKCCSRQSGSVYVGVMLVLATTLLVGATGWLGWQLVIGRRVVASESIGTLQGVLGGGGDRVAMVLETSRGFYPLQEPVALPKGVALVLQVRRNGRRFICDAGGVRCVCAAGRVLGSGDKDPGAKQGPKGDQEPKGEVR